jgi:hypothetical protein
MRTIEILKGIKDRREWNGKKYHLWAIILFSILAIAANAKTYIDIQRFIEINFDDLKKIFNLKWRRYPTISGIWKILTGIDLDELELAFRQLASELQPQIAGGRHICFDGKSLCGSASETKKEKAVRIFNAFSNVVETVIAHIFMDCEKDSEAGTPEKFLQTLDAAHCQKKFKPASEAEAIFVTQVKNNQKSLLNQIKHGCVVNKPADFFR